MYVSGTSRMVSFLSQEFTAAKCCRYLRHIKIQKKTWTNTLGENFKWRQKAKILLLLVQKIYIGKIHGGSITTFLPTFFLFSQTLSTFRSRTHWITDYSNTWNYKFILKSFMAFWAEEMALEKKNPKEDGKKMTLHTWFLDVFRLARQFV